jgi:non-heme chloroperoxidase
MMIRSLRGSVTLAALSLVAAFATTAAGAGAVRTHGGFVKTRDGIKIHYVEAGAEHSKLAPSVVTPPTFPDPNFKYPGMQLRPSILFVSGWTMPGWIWEKQIAHFAQNYHVVAMDPRCQGASTQTSDGLSPAARARDIKAVVDRLHLAPVVLVGWSMAVGEIASYVEQFGTADAAAFVFVDDAPGADIPAAQYKDLLGFINGFNADRRAATLPFVRSWFKKPQPEDYIHRVVEASLRTPTNTAVALLVGKFGTDNRAALAKIHQPTLIVGAKSSYDFIVRDMQKQIPGSRLEIFEDAGHALFVDDADRFNSLLEAFLATAD